MTPSLVGGRPVLAAHRGASAIAPENTLPAFERAWQDGADAVECDVRLTADGVPVLCHDDTLRRVAGLAAPVESLTYADVTRLDAGVWMGADWTGTPMPTLAEALVWSQNRVPLIIELKASPEPEPLVRATARVLAEVPGRVRVCSSFSVAILRALQVHAPDTRRALIAAAGFDSAVDAASSLGVTELYFKADAFLTAGGARNLRALTLPVLFWTVDDLATARALLSAGAAGMVSNRPGELAALVHHWVAS